MLGVLAGVVLLAVVYWLVGASHGRHTAEEKEWAKGAFEQAKGWYLCRGNPTPGQAPLLKKAVDIYLERHGLGSFSNTRCLHEFIERWAVQHPRLSDINEAPRPGPTPHMTDEECERCIAELRKGYYVGDVHWYFTSLSHAAQHSDIVAEYRHRYSPNDESGMWKRLRTYDPKLIKFTPKLVPPMPAALARERVATSAFLYSQGLAYLKRVFWIDEKVVYMEPKSRSVIGYEDDAGNVVLEIDQIKYYNAISHQNDHIRVCFYSMVNYWKGACGFWVSQSTTGQPQKYKVNAHPLFLTTLAGTPVSLHAERASSRAACQLPSLWSSSRRSTL
jgi:hypothetical protein